MSTNLLSPWSIAVFVVVVATAPAAAQSVSDSDASNDDLTYGTGFGAEILLTNSGFGIGGYFHRAVSQATSIMGELSLGAGKDERELKFFRFGNSYIPNKANYLLMMPVQGGVIHRLFRNTIADNFRPYVQVSAGPTMGWEYPYFDDVDGDGEYDSAEEDTYDSIGAIPKGEFRMGLGGTIAIGAHFGDSEKMAQGVRIGYSFTRFFEGIQLLEPQVQSAERFFGTPTITLTFGRLL